ncbi:uncharacterized protein F5147DRAFT_272315 [Suillus discolor]|uniref:C2H2-type domain-containing protein n=1 Tax=Suillus discolor TaxID=1912936 RepID=A0A9P7F2K9_9AGAM|nr:uncharacterized protein F5147DRAFT_272315 [Suillus discolor]KAG2104090.1 hypothetical protein F5147DRAFT_272315 [Suillus discolor]
MSAFLSAPHNDPTPATDFSNHTICSWDSGLGIPCGAYISVSNLSKHLSTHGVNGPAKSVISCAWGDCGRAAMKRENVIRHVEEVHLQVKYLCDQCNASFSRKSTRNAHVFKLHSYAS